MLRLIAFLPVAALLLLLVLFAISNPAPVGLMLWPLDLVWQVPLAGAVLGAAALAFLLGALLAWGTALRNGARARRLQREVTRLETELAALRARQPIPAVPPPPGTAPGTPPGAAIAASPAKV